METLKWIVQLSRPRFWFYLLGPALIAFAATIESYIVGKTWESHQWDVLIVLLFFSLPANLLIYGINDLFDYETDKHNPKKRAYEQLLEPDKRAIFLRNFFLIFLIGLLPLLFVILFDIEYTPARQYKLFFDPNLTALWGLVGFMFFGLFYSTPPIRAKVVPFLDSFFNILYVFPGIVMYAVITDEWPAFAVILAGSFWCMAMHAFSAIPDIASDKKAGIKTIATTLGKSGTLLFCALFYGSAAILAYQYIGIFSVIGGVIYLGLMSWSWVTISKKELFFIYKLFPYVNVSVGFLLFWMIFLKNYY